MCYIFAILKNWKILNIEFQLEIIHAKMKFVIIFKYDKILKNYLQLKNVKLLKE